MKNTVTKVVLTYGDGTEAVFTGQPVDLSTLPTFSPDEQKEQQQGE